MILGSYTLYLGRFQGASNKSNLYHTVHENNVILKKKTSLIHVRFRYNLLTVIKNRS